MNQTEFDAFVAQIRAQLFGGSTPIPPPVVILPPAAPPIIPPPSPGGGNVFSYDINAFTPRPFAMTWPLGNNADLPSTGPWGVNDVLILGFTTPPDLGDRRIKVMMGVEHGQGSFGTMRFATIADSARCGGGIRSIYNQTPSFNMKVGPPPVPRMPYDTTCYLNPATQYFVTIINRAPDGSPPATPNTYEMKIHFNN